MTDGSFSGFKDSLNEPSFSTDFSTVSPIIQNGASTLLNNLEPNNNILTPNPTKNITNITDLNKNAPISPSSINNNINKFDSSILANLDN